MLSDWNRELRRGLLQLIILIKIRITPLHGYAIFKEVREDFFCDIKAGTIYSLLQRLKDREIVGIFKKDDYTLYKLTPLGLNLLEKMIKSWHPASVTIQDFITQLFKKSQEDHGQDE